MIDRKKTMLVGGLAATALAAMVAIAPVSPVSPLSTDCVGSASYGNVRLAAVCWKTGTSTTTTGTTTTTTTPSGSCPGLPNEPDGEDPWGGCWPGPETVGIPPGTVLTTYTGPLTITVANTTINAKTVNGNLNIRAAGFRLTNSRVNGWVFNDDRFGGGVMGGTPVASTTIEDSHIFWDSFKSPAAGHNQLTVRRSDLERGEDSMMCTWNCILEDSWLHDQTIDPASGSHADGYQNSGGSNGLIRHNSIECKPGPSGSLGANCTAPLALFGDWSTIRNQTVDRNLFLATHGSYCFYGGSTPGKPFPQADNVIVTENVFKRTGPDGRGRLNTCGFHGPYVHYSPEPGSVFSGNMFDDGTPLN